VINSDKTPFRYVLLEGAIEYKEQYLTTTYQELKLHKSLNTFNTNYKIDEN
jgi:hypothetical protein